MGVLILVLSCSISDIPSCGIQQVLMARSPSVSSYRLYTLHCMVFQRLCLTPSRSKVSKKNSRRVARRTSTLLGFALKSCGSS